MKKNTHPFSSDRPIEKASEDVLNRVEFVNQLAEAILSWKEKDSLVISLQGNWGAGKSSIKNMLVEKISTHKKTSPIIIEFNPWQWSGQDQLMKAFFNEIGTKLGVKSENHKKLATQWNLYSAKLNLLSYVGDGIKIGIKEILIILSALGLGSLDFITQSASTYKLILIALITISALAPALPWISKLFDHFGKINELTAELNEKTLEEVKRELCVLLRELKNPILVIIDDIDRLTSEEILTIFRLIKANADFPNLVYLTLFQSDIVNSAIESQETALSGQEYLKKIVQVNLDIPAIDIQKVHQILFMGLDRILNEDNINTKFEKSRWDNIFLSGLNTYFKSLRDVFRFLATLDFYFGIFKKNNVLEINPVDLIAIESIRSFEPVLYERLKSEKNLLTQHLYAKPSKEFTTKIDDILGLCQNEYTKEILKLLFPNIDSRYSGTIYHSSVYEKWETELRVCDKSFFDRYFYLAIPANDVPQQVIEDIISESGNKPALVSIFTKLKKESLLDYAILRLEPYKQKIEIKNAVPFVSALFDISDEVDDDMTGFASISPFTHLTRIIYWFLLQEEDPEKRAQILYKAFEETTGIYGPLERTFTESKEQRQEGHIYLVNENDAQKLIDICLGKIKHLVESNSLATHAKLGFILTCWNKWSSDNSVKSWVESLTSTDSGLIIFFKAFSRKSISQTMGEKSQVVKESISIKEIEKYVDIEKLREKVDKINLSSISAQDARYIDLFNKSYRRMLAGKSDDPFFD